MRITTVRIIVQIIMFALFAAFVLLTSFAQLNHYPNLRFWLSKFLEIDPLVALSTAITTHTLYKGLLWSLIIVVPTLLLGRIFCNWICPFGITHHFIGWILGPRTTKERIAVNRYHRVQTVKYYILIGMLVAALFGTLQIGLLDPIVHVYRAFTIAVYPVANMPLSGIELPGGITFGDHAVHGFTWVIGALFLFFVGMNIIWPRFFCRVLCPLGALLGSMSRFALWRIERHEGICTGCNLCTEHCEGACEPQADVHLAECFVCMNCIQSCPHGAITFDFMPNRAHEVTGPNLNKRHAIFAAISGMLFFSWTKASAKTTKDFSAKVVRPPGSVEEQEFLERCIKCAQCVRTCPTNVLQPTLFEAGIEGLWTPVMNYRIGYCQYECTACGLVCPTGAIQHLTPDEKLGMGEFRKQGPIKLGTAHYDHGRCLPWSKNIPCMVCEEVCPVSPKAIHAEERKLLVREGKKRITDVNGNAITLADWPHQSQNGDKACNFEPHAFVGDQAGSYHVEITGLGTPSREYRVNDNDNDTLLIEGPFEYEPAVGDTALIHIELRVPKIDTDLCIGCGICENVCPVVGDRRAVYVTPDGETRSQYYLDEHRNRTLRLRKS